MGPGQPGSRGPGNPVLAIIAAILALVTLISTVVFRLTQFRLRFHTRFPFVLEIPGYAIVIVLLAVGAVLLLMKRRPGLIVVIVGAVLDIAVVLFFSFAFPRIITGVLAIATLVVCIVAAANNALPASPAAAPFMPAPPGQFYPQGQPAPPQQFAPQPGFPAQQPPFPPQQPPLGYPQQQFPPPPPGQQPPGYPPQPPGP
jgi:hypothetical protein